MLMMLRWVAWTLRDVDKRRDPVVTLMVPGHRALFTFENWCQNRLDRETMNIFCTTIPDCDILSKHTHKPLAIQQRVR